jgi:type VI secretion system secreted protein VgrG
LADSTELHNLVFIAEGLGAGVARVRRLTAHEGLSVSYLAEIDIELSLVTVEPRAWVLRDAMLGVFQASDGTVLRRLGGVVMRVRETATRGQRQRITVFLESPLARLRLSSDHRIFQEQTTQQIVATLLDDAGIPADKVSFRLSGSYPTREVCTQFGENAFVFLSRILEEDGIFYFFEHAEDGTTVVFADAASAYAKTTPADDLPFLRDSGLVSSQALTELIEYERVRPAKVTLRDHDFKRPALDLTAAAQGDAALGLEHYDYPGRYVDPGEGKRRAQLRLDAMTAASTGARGSSTVFSLAPGHTFTMKDAPDPAVDKEWVVVDLETAWDDSGGKQSFANHFHVVPTSIQYRPPQKTPRGVVPGPQLAIVTGPTGAEIHTDEFGRVKVFFPWDRRSTHDDKSSCWIRVGQMHGSGAVAIPRIGWEVLVDFEDGDPDRPVVVGRLYNGKYGPPYPLPGNKTVSSLQSKSTPGGTGANEIRMNDSGGGEQMAVHAQKDMNVNVANDKTEKVTTNATLGVGSNHKVSVGGSETLKVGAACEIAVGASQTWSVGASRTKTISGDEKVTIGGSRSMTIGGSHTLSTPKSVGESTPAAFSETIGGSCVEAAALGVGIAVAGAASVSVGAVKLEACATGKGDFVIGAQASTIGGAFIAASGKDCGIGVKGAKATTVGGAWAATAAADVELSSDAALNITVGGALAFNAGKITLKVGGSTVTIADGAVVIKSGDIKLTATGPQPELAAMVSDK